MFPSLTLPPALLRCAALNRPNAVAFGSARFQEVSRMPGQGKRAKKCGRITSDLTQPWPAICPRSSCVPSSTDNIRKIRINAKAPPNTKKRPNRCSILRAFLFFFPIRAFLCSPAANRRPAQARFARPCLQTTVFPGFDFRPVRQYGIMKPGALARLQSVEKVAERHFFELSQVLPLAFAPGRQNLQSTKTSGFSSVLTHLSSEPDGT